MCRTALLTERQKLGRGLHKFVYYFMGRDITELENACIGITEAQFVYRIRHFLKSSLP
jgi:hypothetical protein